MSQHGQYKVAICNVWLYKGTCPFGTRCTYAHGIQDWVKSMEGQQNARQKKTVCRFWLSNNKCTKGDECAFLHQQPVIEDDDEDENEDEEEFDLEQHLGIGIQKAIRNGSTAESSTGTFNYRTNKATGSSGMGKTSSTEIEKMIKRLVKAELEKTTKNNKVSSSPTKTTKSKKSPAAGTNGAGQQQKFKAFSSTENDEEY